MGLNAALVDRARLIRQQYAGRVVDGETQYAPTAGAWFKCRLELERQVETLDEATQERKVVRTPAIMHAIRDEEGDPVVLTVEDRLEIESRELGDGQWDVTAAPAPMRKKRRVIGWEATLKRIEIRGNPG